VLVAVEIIVELLLEIRFNNQCGTRSSCGTYQSLFNVFVRSGCSFIAVAVVRSLQLFVRSCCSCLFVSVAVDHSLLLQLIIRCSSDWSLVVVAVGCSLLLLLIVHCCCGLGRSLLLRLVVRYCCGWSFVVLVVGRSLLLWLVIRCSCGWSFVDVVVGRSFWLVVCFRLLLFVDDRSFSLLVECRCLFFVVVPSLSLFVRCRWLFVAEERLLLLIVRSCCWYLAVLLFVSVFVVAVVVIDCRGHRCRSLSLYVFSSLTIDCCYCMFCVHTVLIGNVGCKTFCERSRSNQMRIVFPL